MYFVFIQLQTYQTADIVIEIPGNLGQDDSSYRLDYYPPFGNPEPNTTIASRDVGDEIQFSNVLAGTKYDFNLFYTNATLHNFLAWTVSITTGKFSRRFLGLLSFISLLFCGRAFSVRQCVEPTPTDTLFSISNASDFQ